MSFKKQGDYKFSKFLVGDGSKISELSSSDASAYQQLPSFLIDASGPQEKRGTPKKGYRYLFFTLIMFVALTTLTIYQTINLDYDALIEKQ